MILTLLRSLGLFLAASALCLAAADKQLIDAVKLQNPAAARARIAAHVDVNGAEPDGFTALHLAAERNNLELVNLLLAAGASAKATSHYRITPLYLACNNGNAAI